MSDERELEREAEAVRAAYRKLPRAEPPPALDRAVLAQARAALGQAPAKPEGVRRPRWLLPVGLAATAVLAIGVASRMGKEPEDRWPARPVAPAATQAPPTGAVLSDSKRKADEPAGREAEARSDLGKLQAKDAEGGGAPAPLDEAAPAPAQPKAAAEDERYREARKARPAERRFRAPPPAAAPEAPPAMAPAYAPPPAPPPPVVAAPAPAIEEAAVPSNEPAPEPFPRRDDDSRAKEVTTPALRQESKQEVPAPAAKKALAAPAPAGERQNLERGRAAEADQLEAAQSKPASVAEPQAGASRARASGGLMGGQRGAIDPTERAHPEAWLQAIRRVLAQGDEGQARRELRLFRRQYPVEAIPDDLKRLAE